MVVRLDWSAPFWNDPQSLYMSVVTALIIFPVVIGLIRVFGKRSTSKMNNFDWIVTVAIGAIAASAMTFAEVSIVSATITIVVLLGMQWIVTHIVERNETIEQIIQEDAAVLVFKGQILDAPTETERVSRKEIDAAIRQAGLSRLDQVYALILESNAEFSVIKVGDASRDDDVLREFELPPDDFEPGAGSNR